MKENDFILLALCLNNANGVADGEPGFHSVKPEWIFYADSCNLLYSYLDGLYKHAFEATKQLATWHYKHEKGSVMCI